MSHSLQYGHFHYSPFADIQTPIRLKKINKCFSGHFFEKQMRQAGFVFFVSPKKDEATFFYFLFY